MIPSRPLTRRPAVPALLRFADAVLNPRTGDLLRGARSIRLSPTEARLLALLMRAAGAVVTRTQIERALWGDGPVTRCAVDNAVRRLRPKLDAAGETRLLHTAYGTGYLLRVARDGGSR